VGLGAGGTAEEPSGTSALDDCSQAVLAFGCLRSLLHKPLPYNRFPNPHSTPTPPTQSHREDSKKPGKQSWRLFSRRRDSDSAASLGSGDDNPEPTPHAEAHHSPRSGALAHAAAAASWVANDRAAAAVAAAEPPPPVHTSPRPRHSPAVAGVAPRGQQQQPAAVPRGEVRMHSYDDGGAGMIAQLQVS